MSVFLETASGAGSILHIETMCNVLRDVEAMHATVCDADEKGVFECL